MLCKKPFFKGVLPYGCAQCQPCRINRRRLWASRILLESMKHSESAFVTLTYTDDSLKKFCPGASLVPKHAQLWLKKLRKKLAPAPIRYYLVGEYGDQTHRPHYHAALFGYPPCVHFSLSDPESLAGRSRCQCLPCSTLRESWGYGKTDCGTLNKDSAQYLAGYVTKKMTSKNDVRLDGRHPEFARMSLKPGIGATAVDDIANVLTGTHGVNSILNTKDVPISLKLGKSGLPLGRYIRSKLREKIVGEKGCEIIKRENQARYALEMRELYAVSRSNQVSEGFKSASEIVHETSAQDILNLESRTKIWSKKGSI